MDDSNEWTAPALRAVLVYAADKFHFVEFVHPRFESVDVLAAAASGGNLEHYDGPSRDAGSSISSPPI